LGKGVVISCLGKGERIGVWRIGRRCNSSRRAI